MALSSAVTAGTNATSTQYNNLRTDAITRERVYVFYVYGAVGIANEQGAKYIVPANATITGVTTIIASGTSATVRIQKDTTDVDTGISATTTVATDSSFTGSGSITAGQVLSMDVTGVSGSPVDLIVQVKTTETI